LIPCLIVEDREWDLATWEALIRGIVPWIDGGLTGRGKRCIRKMLKAHPALAAVIGPRPARDRAKGIMQATSRPRERSVVSAAATSGVIKAPGAPPAQKR